jgi:hypothetical protein
MRTSLILPAHPFIWAPGRPSGGGVVPLRALILKLDRIRKIVHAFKDAHWVPEYGLEAAVKKWRGRDRKTLVDKGIPGFPAGRAESFPGIGRASAFAPLSPAHLGAPHSIHLSSSATRLLKHLPDFGAFLKWKFSFQALPRRGRRRLAAVPACWGRRCLLPCRRPLRHHQQLSFRHIAPPLDRHVLSVNMATGSVTIGPVDLARERRIGIWPTKRSRSRANAQSAMTLRALRNAHTGRKPTPEALWKMAAGTG